jgi:hypothetical protein
MTNLKGRLKTIGIFALGFLTGTVLIGILLVWNYTVMFRNLYQIQILDCVNTASMVRSGRGDILLKHLEDNIPQNVFFANSVLKGQARLDSLWCIQRYYEQYNLNVPVEIRPILNKLPPRPLTTCELYYSQKKNPGPNTPKPNAPLTH